MKVPNEDEDISFSVKADSMKDKRFELTLGNYTSSFEGSRFSLIDKSLCGVKLKAGYKNIDGTIIYSTPRGYPKRERFKGNNTQGPFQLSHIPVVYNSERVKLGEGLDLKQVKKGTDYEIDYEEGTITFLNRVITERENIEVDYEHSPSSSKDVLYGTKINVKVTEFLKFGIAYVDEHSLQPDREPVRVPTSYPKKQSIIAFNNELTLGEYLKLESEIAHNEVRSEKIEAESEWQETRTDGNAYRIDSKTNLSNFNLNTHFRRTEPNFTPIGKTDFGLDMLNWGADINYKPIELLELTGAYDDLKEKQVHGILRNSILKQEINREAGIKITPSFLKEISYRIDAEDEYQNREQSRWSRSHTTKIEKEFKYLILGTNYKIVQSSRLKVKSEYNVVGFSLATNNIRFITLSSNLENERNRDSNEMRGNASISITPHKRYLCSGNASLADNSLNGRTVVANASYRATPIDKFKTDGRYQIEELKRTSTEKKVTTHTGSFRFELEPVKRLRLSYKPNIKFTSSKEDRKRLYTSKSDLYELLWQPNKYISTGYNYQTRKIRSYETSFWKSKKRGHAYKLRVAPTQSISFNTEYRTKKDDRIWGESNYKHENKDNLDFSAHLRIHQKAQLEVGYDYERYNKEVIDTIDTKTVTHGLRSKLTQDINSYLAIYGLSSYKKKYGQDPFISLTNSSLNISIFSPGAGVMIRWNNTLNSELGYKFEKSTGDDDNFIETVNFDLSINHKYVQFTIRTEYKHSVDPYYRTSEIGANLRLEM